MPTNRFPPEKLHGLLGMARRSGIMAVGRERAARMRGQPAFIWITRDLSANSRREIARLFPEVPIIEAYSSAELEQNAGLINTKVVGFARSPLALRIREFLEAAASPSPEPPAPRSGRSENKRPIPKNAAKPAAGKTSRSRKRGRPHSEKPGSKPGRPSAPNIWRKVQPPSNSD